MSTDWAYNQDQIPWGIGRCRTTLERTFFSPKECGIRWRTTHALSAPFHPPEVQLLNFWFGESQRTWEKVLVNFSSIRFLLKVKQFKLTEYTMSWICSIPLQRPLSWCHRCKLHRLTQAGDEPGATKLENKTAAMRNLSPIPSRSKALFKT